MSIRCNLAMTATFVVAASSVSSCGFSPEQFSTEPSVTIIDCILTLSYAEREYDPYGTRNFVRPGKELGSGRYLNCDEPLETVTVARVPGFSPKVVVRLINTRDKKLVYIRLGVLHGDKKPKELPLKFRRLLLAKTH
jgi:hypothetical protein